MTPGGSGSGSSAACNPGAVTVSIPALVPTPSSSASPTTVVVASERPPPSIVQVTNARGTGSCLTELMTRTGRTPSGTDTAISPPPIGTSRRLTYSELVKCAAMSAGPGGKLASVTRPSAPVVPRHLDMVSEVAIRDGIPRPTRIVGDADGGLSGWAVTTTPFAGPVGDEIRNIALPATTMRVLTVPVAGTVMVRASERY